MTGWRTVVSGEYAPAKGVIGIVVAQKFPEPTLIREKIEEGIERVSPDTVWVMRDSERKGHAANFAWATFKAHGIEPFLAPLVPKWKLPDGHDLRASWRDIEIRSTCERIIVFHDKSSNVTAEWLTYCEDRKEHPGDGGHCLAKIYVVERGKIKTKTYRKGRAPH